MATQLTFKGDGVESPTGGVTVPWLMKAFRMGRATVERKLAGVEPIGYGKHRTPLYDLPEAASYLVKPKGDLLKLLKEMKPEDMPERLREAYWGAKLKQQRWEEKAGHLWTTSSVMDVFSNVLTEIRIRLQLVPDAVERDAGLDMKQIIAVRATIDGIQDEIHKAIQAIAEGGETLSQLGRDRLEVGEEELAEDEAAPRPARNHDDIL
ncbi:MAG TPA: DUF1441 family protein [Aurantimonas coralicida]|uniref:DUF1441 family protein n=2 Tax=root TaxID=1 RepID=A0A9C9NIN9_9HYPH|nr:DUF1441 family protein [Aurantimonas coralicida]HEU02630.1 DUF1441 family protein [Aurantimonas coralicida]